MKTTKILYWIFNGLFAFLMMGSGIPDILSADVAVKGMHNVLGYPLYFIPFIGVAKALGALTIIIPGYPKLKEWAYAGLFFDLIGATYSIIACGQPDQDWSMIVPLSIAVASYVFYRRKQRNATAQKSQQFDSIALSGTNMSRRLAQA
jgi:hypothetical protein